MQHLIYLNTFFPVLCSNSSSPNHQGDGTSQGSGDVSVCFLLLTLALFAQRQIFVSVYLIYTCLDINRYSGKVFNWSFFFSLFWGVFSVFPFLFFFFPIKIIASNLISYSSFILQPQSRKLSNGCSSIGSLLIQGFFQISQVSKTYYLFRVFVLMSKFCVENCSLKIKWNQYLL